MTDANVPSIRLPGIVYTFYSYKGGVGRSMALVNVGVMLATQGLKVLLVDWDLEAPGLEVYFSKAAVLHGDTTRSLGVLDLLEARVSGRMLSWRDCLLKAEFAGHSLDIITAGSRTADYRRRVQRLNWEALFRDYHVGNFVNDLREEWRNEYDIILVDSRTGVTDTGDICTVLLPDVVVLLFITNYQNIEGIRAVMERAVRVRSKLPINRSKLLGVPVPARDERDREALKFDQWLRIFAKEFSGLYQEWLPAEVDPAEALLRLSIPYIAAWSFGESIPVLESWRNRVDSGSLGAAYTRLATLLAARLDWGALDAKASISDLTSARLEVSALREETKAAEEGRARAEELQIAAELALDRSKMRLRLGRRALAVMVGIALALLGWDYFLSRDTSFESQLVAQLYSSNPDKRKAAIQQIGYDRNITPELRASIAEKLVAIIKNPKEDLSVRGKSLLYLDKYDTDFQHIEQVAPFLEDDVLSYPALLYFSSSGVAGKSFAPQVAAFLGDNSWAFRYYAVKALEGMGPETVLRFVTDIKKLLTDPDKDVQDAASRALNSISKTVSKQP